MAGYPVSVAPTTQLMISHYVSRAASLRTLIGTAIEGQSQQVAYGEPKLLVMYAKAK